MAGYGRGRNGRRGRLLAVGRLPRAAAPTDEAVSATVASAPAHARSAQCELSRLPPQPLTLARDRASRDAYNLCKKIRTAATRSDMLGVSRLAERAVRKGGHHDNRDRAHLAAVPTGAAESTTQIEGRYRCKID